MMIQARDLKIPASLFTASKEFDKNVLCDHHAQNFQHIISIEKISIFYKIRLRDEECTTEFTRNTPKRTTTYTCSSLLGNGSWYYLSTQKVKIIKISLRLAHSDLTLLVRQTHMQWLITCTRLLRTVSSHILRLFRKLLLALNIPPADLSSFTSLFHCRCFRQTNYTFFKISNMKLEYSEPKGNYVYWDQSRLKS